MKQVPTLVFAFLGLTATVLSATFLQGAEDRAAKRYRAAERLGGQVTTADASRVDPRLEGRLIRLKGLAVPEGEVVDPELGVRASGLLLSRSVEMWQWLETEEGGEPVYAQGWSDDLVNSDAFSTPEGHQNPDLARLPPLEVIATTIKVGEYVMPGKLARTIQSRVPVPVASVDSLTLPDELTPASVRDGVLFIGGDPDSPQVGDLRVWFETVESQEVQMLGKQEGNTLTHFGNNPKSPRYLVLKILDQPLFPNLESITTAQIWRNRIAALAGLLLGLGLLRQALPAGLRPGIAALPALALAAAFGTAVAPWLDISGVHAWSFCGVAALSAVAALMVIRRT